MSFSPPNGSMARLVISALFGMALWPIAATAWADEPVPATPSNLSPAPAAMIRQFASEIRPFFQANCYRCHGNGKHKGDIALDQFGSLDALRADHKALQSLHDVLANHEMPPKKAPQPPARQRDSVLKFVSDVIDLGSGAAQRDPGFVPIHRLNRTEYNNTIRDLVGVDFRPADDFPADDSGYGFDNIADVLSMSPLLAEKYLAAAEQVMDKAIVTENPNKPRIYEYSAEKMTGGQILSGGHRILATNGEISQRHKFIAQADYEFRIEAEADQAGDEPARMKVKVDGDEVGTFDVPNRRGRSKVYTVRARVPQGAHRVVMEFTNDFYDPQASNPRRRDRNLIIDSMEIEGPLDLPPPAPSEIQKRLLFCGAADGAEGEACAGRIIRRFATRAFRRPARDDEVNGLLELYRSSRAQGDSFAQGCKLALTAVLVSPQFLYRIELDPPDHPGPHPLNDYELATRLSYFLWSSMPDDELFELADQKKLHEPAVLDAQVARMLGEPKSSAFVTNFAGQWLELRNLASASPDPKVFPRFDEQLRDDMRREGELFFQNILRNDRSVLDLIDGKYTFVNQRLATFYGIDGISGDQFRKVELSGREAQRRGGVLTMAGVLTVTALPNRTSPVRRGKFILDQILGTPPPPPPPDVPPLSEKQTDIDGAPIRQRMESHRSNPSCASCHARMDPLGFSLENFDAIGRWRDRDGRFAIDSSATLPGGQSFDGPEGLRQLLLTHKDQFVRNLVQKLMIYALGRGTEWYDAPTIADICRDAASHGYRFSRLIQGIVHSDAFLKRRPKTQLATERTAGTEKTEKTG